MLHINNQTKAERDAERAEWRKEQAEERAIERKLVLEDREFEKTQTIEYQRREDLVSERDLWCTTVQSLLDNGRSLDQSIGIADKVVEEYKQRFQ